jgi:pyridoxal phosphate enzyme (YggS family)
MSDFKYVENNLFEVNELCLRVSERTGMPMPKLVAVTKSATDEEVLALARLGIGAIGENRPGELVRRGDLLSAAGFTPELHQIGTLQSNKAKLVLPRASLIHSLASESLLRELSRLARRDGCRARVLVEVNSACEPNKDGVLPNDCERFVERVLEYPEIELAGLMTMGPAHSTAEDIRPYFRKTRELFDRIGARYGYVGEGILSMGMTDSYAVAIEEGTTLIRVGRRLFVKE